MSRLDADYLNRNIMTKPKCENCPHESHEFSTCLEWPECQCYNRPGIPGGVCDNTLFKLFREDDKKKGKK